MARVLNLDRRFMYVLVFIVILFPLIKPLGLPVAMTPEVQRTYDWIHGNLFAGDVVFVDIDFDPSQAPELLPQLESVARDLMSSGVRVVLGSFLPGGFLYQTKVVEEIAVEFGYEYGKDIVSLPFKAGNESAYNALGRDLLAFYSEDFRGSRLAGMPLWDSLHGFRDFRAAFCFCAGDQAIWMIRHVGQVTEVPVINGTVASSGAFMTPFWESGQLSGFVVGMSGAAEYESLSGFRGKALSGMDAQSFGHILIALLVVLGNVGYLSSKRKERLAQ